MDRAITTYDLLPEPDLERLNTASGEIIWIDADPLHGHPRWRLDDYVLNDVLSHDAADDIIARFGLTREGFAPLRLTLRRALDPNQTPNVVPIEANRARSRATKTMKAGMERLMTAADHLTRTAETMEPLMTSFAPNLDDARKLDKWREDLDQVLHDIERLHRQLGLLELRPDVALDVSPTDRRRISDGRRIMILHAIFEFWMLTKGKMPTMTTEPLSGIRVGPVVDFVNTIVAQATSPSATLSGETIWQDFKAWRKARRAKC